MSGACAYFPAVFRDFCRRETESDSFGEVTSSVSQAGARLVDSDEPRLARLVEEQFGFVWRLLRRVGVSTVEADEAAKQVFSAVSRRLGDIRAGSERAFLLSTALHVAARVSRGRARAAEDASSSPDLEAESEPSIALEEGLDQRACAIVDELLAEMPLELRVVFALYEIEQLDRTEISEIVGAPLATVTTRLRGARRDFTARVAKLEGTEGAPAESPDEDDELAALASDDGSELVRVLLIAAREEKPKIAPASHALVATDSVPFPESVSSVPPSTQARALSRVAATITSRPPASSRRSPPASTGSLIAKWLLIGVIIGAALSVVGFGLSGAFASAPQQAPVRR